MQNAIELTTLIKNALSEDEKGYTPPQMQQFDSLIVAVCPNGDKNKLYTIKVTELVSSVAVNDSAPPVAVNPENKEN